MQQPSIDLQSRALLHYLDEHLRTRPQRLNLTDGLMQSVSLWMTQAKCPMVDLAISSMALAVYSRTQRYPPAATEALVKYQKLLQLTQSIIPCLNETNIDSCLLTIFLMSRYEGVVHTPGNGIPIIASLSVFSHHDGAMAVLKNWKNKRYTAPTSDIVKHSRRGIIKSAILRSISIPEWMKDGAVFGEEGTQLTYDKILVRLLNLRYDIFSLLRTGTNYIPDTVEDLTTQLLSLDLELEEWKDQFPKSWKYTKHALPSSIPLPTDHFFSRDIYTYPTLTAALHHTQYFWTRMLLISTQLRLSHFTSSSSSYPTSQFLSSTLQFLSHSLAASIPYILNKIHTTSTSSTPSISSSSTENLQLNKYDPLKGYTASLVVWPLSIASSLYGVDLDLQTWFRAELSVLGKVIGARVLECAADGRSWLDI